MRSEVSSGGKETGEGDEIIDMFMDSLKKNVMRSRIMADLWSDELHGDIGDDIPVERFIELYRIISFDIMENILTIVPPEEAMVIATNLDHYLQIEILNKRFEIDIMDEFQKEFVAEYGERLPTDKDFIEVVANFENDWSSTVKEYLGGLTPNQALEQAFTEWRTDSDSSE